MAAANDPDPNLSASAPGPGRSFGSAATDGADGATNEGAYASGDDAAARTTHHAADVVKERAGAVWDDAREAARATLSEQKDAAADGLGDVADALRGSAERQRGEPSREPIAQLTRSAAEQLDRLSSTLRSKDLGSMVRDMDHFARERPMAFFGLALAAGLLAARFVKSSND